MSTLAIRAALLAVALTAAGSLAGPPSYAASTYTVTNRADSGTGSLRDAINRANASRNVADTIAFSIGSGPATIAPTSPLPVIIDPVTLDGTTQPGYSGIPVVEIRGDGAGARSLGIRLTGAARGSLVRGLIINRFAGQGIFIDTDGVTVVNSYIGTRADGLAGAGNGGDGVAIFAGVAGATASGVVIGGSSPESRNVISGNGGNGVGVTVQDNGIANDVVISGNFIGTDVNGTGAIGNRGDGILVNHPQGIGRSERTVIGGSARVSPGASCTGACNLISANGANGIGLWHTGVTASRVFGNFVGTDVTGTRALGNTDIGIEVNETANNSIGGASPDTRNILSGNGGAGLFLTGASATGNVVAGNFIGTNSSGTAAVSNLKMGVGIGASPGAVGANSNIIGGASAATTNGACSASCNLISGNRDNGVLVIGVESFGQRISGNVIGLSADQNSAIGNIRDGIGILNAPNTLVGGADAASGNVVGSNGSNGVIVVGRGSTGTTISRDVVGRAAGGRPFGNQDSGISVAEASATVISATGTAYNGRLGIDLGNNGTVDRNDPSDGDIGANNGQNFPSVFSATSTPSVTRLGGQFNGTPNGSFRLEFFVSDGCNAGAPADFGEGSRFLGSTDVSTDRFGNTAWGYSSGTSVPGNTYVTATATRLSANGPLETSEFSQCVLVNAAKPALTNGAGWFLKNGLTTGPADQQFGYGFPSAFLMCAWDPNQPGVKLPVIYAGGAWYMRASYSTGTADLTVAFGGDGQRPICGDWNGDGVDTVGVVDSRGVWSLRNSNSTGAPDIPAFAYGSGGRPVAGDWNGDGTDTIGTVDVTTSGLSWSLRNRADSGAPDAGSFMFGAAETTPVVGDWNGDRADTVGSVTTGGTWRIRNANSAGSLDGEFQFGFVGATPLVW